MEFDGVIRGRRSIRAATLEAAGEPADPAAALARMADLCGAPCLVVFGSNECLAEAYADFDTDAFVQNVGRAAYDRGLGTCIVATVIRYPDLLRRLLPGAEGKRFVVSVKLGSPVPDSPANTFARSRADRPRRARHLGLVGRPAEPCPC